MRVLIRRNFATYRVQTARLLLVACCLAIAAHAQAPYQVRSIVRFEDAKTHQPLDKSISAASMRVTDDGQQALSVQLSSAEELPLRLVLAFDVSGSGRHSESLEAFRNSIPALLKEVVRPGKDSVIVVDFNDRCYVDAGPTDDFQLVVSVLKKYDQHRGGTALFDTVITVSRKLHGEANRAQERRVLLLFSDGMDNASHSDVRSAIAEAEASGVSIFTVSTHYDEEGPDRGKKTLALLATETGGRAFGRIKTKRLDDFYNLLRRVLESQYVLTYTLLEPPVRNKRRPLQITSTGHDVRVFVPQRTIEQ